MDFPLPKNPNKYICFLLKGSDSRNFYQCSQEEFKDAYLQWEQKNALEKPRIIDVPKSVPKYLHRSFLNNTLNPDISLYVVW
jgi:hypothetical protein